MENVGFKGLLKTLWQRVVLSYKTTLIGLGVMALGFIIENLAHSNNHTVATIFGLLGGGLVLLKEKLPAPPAA